MDIMINRVKQLLAQIESDYSDLSVVKKTYGYCVTYRDSFCVQEMIDIYKLNLKRTTYIVRWTTNGDIKLRLPVYKKEFSA